MVNIERVTDAFGVVFHDNFYFAIIKLPFPLPVVFWKMIIEMDNQNRVFVGKPFKLELILRDKVDISEDGISNQIYSLAKHNFIKRLGYNYYVINPDYVARGNMLYIAKLKLQYEAI